MSRNPTRRSFLAGWELTYPVPGCTPDEFSARETSFNVTAVVSGCRLRSVLRDRRRAVGLATAVSVRSPLSDFTSQGRVP